jgi:MFS family permease
VPYGVLADTYGRVIIIALTLIGFVLADVWTATVMICYQIFPTRAALASSAFHIIGGGRTVIIPIILAMISDTVPPEMRYVAVQFHPHWP